jgi:hypothetical protein
MEADAKPILWALSHAEGRSLDTDEQRVLARWALLKACVFDEVHPNERVVPVAHRQHLYEHKDPPGDGLWVFLATYEAEELRHYASQGLLLGAGDGPAPTAPTDLLRNHHHRRPGGTGHRKCPAGLVIAGRLSPGGRVGRRAGLAHLALCRV